MGRRDVARRRLTGAGIVNSGFRAASEPELICRPGGFPPGTTVDELHWYSRRRPHDISTNRDNLYLESGSLKDITSEYTRCFRAPPVVARSLGDIAKDLEEEKENENMRRCSSHSEDLFGNPLRNVSNPEHRHRRCFQSQDGLRLEGDMLFHTEKADQFTKYALNKRPELLRRNTQLFLEGNIDTVTENQDKFINYENCKRPPLAKRNTNLHLEGDLSYLPEYKEVFVDFPRHRPVTKRPVSLLHVDNEEKMNTNSETLTKFIEHAISAKKPEVIRRNTNLKCEGDFNSLGEYRASYKEYPIVERRASIRQCPSLRMEGEFYNTPEYKAKYTGLLPLKIPANQNTIANRQKYNTYAANITDPLSLHFKPEGSLTVSTDDVTRYGKAPASRKLDSPLMPGYNLRSNDKFEKKVSGLSDIHPATPSLSSPFEDRLTGRPPRAQRTRTYSQTAYTPGRNSEDKNINEIAKKSESETKYVNHGTVRKSQPMKRPESIVMDGKFECQPEYRKAYVDYLIREKLPRYHPVDQIQSESTEAIPIEQEPSTFDEDALKDSMAEDKHQGVIHHKDALPLYKPSVRRTSISSNKSSPRRRSASPSYRLHVTNVDEPKKGFGGTTTKRNHETHKHDDHTLNNADGYNRRITSRPVSPFRNSNQNINEGGMNPLKQTYRRQWEKKYSEPSYNTTYQNSNYIPTDNKSFVVLDRNTNVRRGGNWESSNWYQKPSY